MNRTPPKTKLSDNLSISTITGGLWQIADMERNGKLIDLDLAAESLHKYVEQGITTFDMADHYGSAELIIGRYHEKYGHQQTQFITKWVPEPEPGSMEQVRIAIEKSLERMGTESLDLLQYHAWNYADPTWIDHLFWLQELKQEGLIKNLGVTNFDSAHLKIALTSGVEICTNQVSYSLIDRRASGEMAAICAAFKVKLLAFGVLAGGFLSNKWLGQAVPEQLNTWSQMKYHRFIESAGGWERFQNLLQILEKLAGDKSTSIANLAIGYMLESAEVGSVIVGARLGESEHIDENLKSLDLDWSDEDISKVDQAIETLSDIPGDCGDEYRKPPFLTASGDLSHHISKMPPPYKVVEQSGKKQVFTGTKWESMAGFCRGLMIGNTIRVSGTTSTHGVRSIGGQDPISQTHFILDKIEGVLQSLEASLENVVRTRVYIKHLDHWEEVAAVHGKRFGTTQPTNTMIRADLVGDYLVEIEVEAVVGD